MTMERGGGGGKGVDTLVRVYMTCSITALNPCISPLCVTIPTVPAI